MKERNRNLLEETLAVLQRCDLKESDIEWVGSIDGEYVMSWKKAKKIFNIEYDASYGGQEIASDLVVVGKEWWLERGEYDGSEWWEYKELPQPKEAKPFKNIQADIGWESIKELNE